MYFICVYNHTIHLCVLVHTTVAINLANYAQLSKRTNKKKLKTKYRREYNKYI